jgi:hypothetical protein
MFDKAHILDEIRRTAAANGGMPLGRRRFEKETGIREHDWLQHWARWGDAQRETGLAPTEKTVGYGDDLLIQKFIGLMRELGKFPTNRELRLKAAKDGEFPGEKSYRRFGGNKQFAAQIAGYCQRHAGLDDIIQLCAAVTQGPTRPDQTLNSQRPIDGSGVRVRLPPSIRPLLQDWENELG